MTSGALLAGMPSASGGDRPVGQRGLRLTPPDHPPEIERRVSRVGDRDRPLFHTREHPAAGLDQYRKIAVLVQCRNDDGKPGRPVAEAARSRTPARFSSRYRGQFVRVHEPHRADHNSVNHPKPDRIGSSFSWPHFISAVSGRGAATVPSSGSVRGAPIRKDCTRQARFAFPLKGNRGANGTVCRIRDESTRGARHPSRTRAGAFPNRARTRRCTPGSGRCKTRTEYDK
jgi:hypothetical protein